MLPNTSFRLQPVLNVASGKVDMLEVEFAQLKLAHKDETEILTRLESSRREEMEKLQREQRGKINCQSVLLRQQFLDVLDNQVARQQVRVDQALSQVNSKRDELVEGMKSQKTLEKLKSNHQSQQALDMRRRESRIIDDIVTTRYARER
jgi:flagellar export protein FliJ